MKASQIFIAVLMLLTGKVCMAAGASLLYIPMDNRPVCLDYTVRSMEAAGWSVEVPSEEDIASGSRAGNPEKLFTWLEDKMGGSEAVVVSGDALIYGGLVASRTHEIPLDVLLRRAERLTELKKKFRGKKFYVFSTIMRSPKSSSAPVEPAYYAQWGQKLFRLGALEDKLELKVISKSERKELKSLREEIPADILNDMYGRRENNLKVTKYLLHGVESGDFDYMLVGRDDTSSFSQAHKEARELDILVHELPRERIRFFAGADELGLLLLTRAYTRLKYELPLVNAVYAPGKGGATIPSYEDNTVAESVKQHIYAAGAFPVSKGRRADLTLAVNTPSNGITEEASSAANTYDTTAATEDFLGKIATLSDSKPVAVADVKYGNGADNAFVKGLFAGGLAYKIVAYNGWNTSGNTIGFSIGQGLLSKNYAEDVRRELLQQRYLDDWAYQANVRMQTYRQLIWPNHWPNSGLSREQKSVAEKEITQSIRLLTSPYLGDVVDEYNFTLPWSRMFEIKVEKRR